MFSLPPVLAFRHLLLGYSVISRTCAFAIDVALLGRTLTSLQHGSTCNHVFDKIKLEEEHTVPDHSSPLHLPSISSRIHPATEILIAQSSSETMNLITMKITLAFILVAMVGTSAGDNYVNRCDKQPANVTTRVAHQAQCKTTNGK